MADLISTDYAGFLADLKTRIHLAQTRAALSVNRELIALYFDIGRLLVEKQETLKWGDAVIAQIARDLKSEFPALTGFSRSKLFSMRQFYLAYRDMGPIVPQPVGQIPWGHNILLLEKEKDPQKRLWYAEKTIENGWSRAVLTYQLETDLHARQTSEGKSHNFDRTLPPIQSDLAAALLKDEYVFDFLSLAENVKERDLETALLLKIRDLRRELRLRVRRPLQREPHRDPQLARLPKPIDSRLQRLGHHARRVFETFERGTKPMKTLQFRLPDSIHAELKQRALQEGVSLNQLLVVAASNEVVRGETRDFFRQAASHYNRADFEAALGQIADAPPIEGDELP